MNAVYFNFRNNTLTLIAINYCCSQQPTEEDPDEGVKDLVEITLKLMVCTMLFIFQVCISEEPQDHTLVPQ